MRIIRFCLSENKLNHIYTSVPCFLYFYHVFLFFHKIHIKKDVIKFHGVMVTLSKRAEAFKKLYKIKHKTSLIFIWFMSLSIGTCVCARSVWTKAMLSYDWLCNGCVVCVCVCVRNAPYSRGVAKRRPVDGFSLRIYR